MSEEEKKAVESFKNDLKRVKNKLILCKQGLEDLLTILNLIEKQAKEIEELKEKLFQKNSLIVISRIEDKLEEIDNDYIPKQKIKEKLEEYRNKIKRLKNKQLWNEPVDTIRNNKYRDYCYILEELLESEK